jgi:Kef-type K+ transport system membrane component KefB
MNGAESLRVSVGMISRGEVGLIVAGIGLREGLISQEVFTVVVVLILLTTLVTPLLLRYVFPRPIAPRTPPARIAATAKER